MTDKYFHIKKYRFFARLPDMRSVSGAEIPVSGFHINAGVNSVPSLSINIPIGKDVKSGVSVAVDRIADIIKNNEGEFHLIELIQQAGGTQRKVFTGFISNLVRSNEGGHQSAALSADHWIGLLNMLHPFYSALHTSCDESMINLLVPTSRIWDESELKITPKCVAFTELLSQMIMELAQASADFVNSKVLDCLSKMYYAEQISAYQGIKDAANQTIEKRFPSGYNFSRILSQIKVPLEMRPRHLSMVPPLVKAWLNFYAPPSQRTSLWQMLLTMGSQAGFDVIPKTNEVLIVPEWGAGCPSQDKLFRLENRLSVRDYTTNLNKAGRVRIVPLKAVNYISMRDQMTSGRIASYPDNGYKAGHGDLWVKMDEWQDECVRQAASNDIDNSSTHKKIMESFAESIYYKLLYSGSQVIVITPLDFDLCPGSMCLISGSSNGIHSSDIIGRAAKIESEYSAQSGLATRQITLDFCRPISSRKQDKHTFFTTKKPFSHDTWY